jgi:Protein of unknown function (DUF3800)
LLLCRPLSQTLPIEKDAELIIQDLVPEPLRRKFEFHAKELFSGSDQTKGWRREERYEVLRQFMSLVPKHNLPVLHASLLKAGLVKYLSSLPPQDVAAIYNSSFERHIVQLVAFNMCAKRAEDWFRANATFERGFCIADETKARSVLRAGFREFRRGILKSDRLAFQADHLVDMIYFGNSHESIFLQLADSCAFFIKRMAMNRPDSRPSMNS